MSLDSGLTNAVDAQEQIARFLRQSSYVAKSTGRIKHNAFLPAPDHDTSVFRISNFSPDQITGLAREHVGELSKNGAALLEAKVIRKAKLEITAHEPPPRHANIRNWSMNPDNELRKAERKASAMILAEEASWIA